MVESSKPRVLITGITGYLGAMVCHTFLKSDQFIVRGTVRDKKNQKKMQPLKEGFGEELFNKLELVEADLLNEESIIEACKDCTYVVHTASPFPLKMPKNEDELIKPAVEGTLAAMKGAEKYGVKRIVITSSIAAIFAQKQGFDRSNLDESIWSDVDAAKPYPKSKTLAEKAAWDFVNKLPEGKKIEVVTINPSLILGPSFIKSDFSSGELIARFMSGKVPGMPKIMLAVVDVREVAQAHLEAILRPEAAGQRFILSSENLWFKDMGQILKNTFGDSYRIPTKELKFCLVKTAAVFDSSLKSILPDWGVEIRMNNQKSKEVLGINYRPAQETFDDFVNFMIDNGYLKDKRKKKK